MSRVDWRSISREVSLALWQQERKEQREAERGPKVVIVNALGVVVSAIRTWGS